MTDSTRVLLTLAYFSLSGQGRFPAAQVIYATIETRGELAVGASVDLYGVPIGTVTHVERRDRSLRVRMVVDPRAQLRSATAEYRHACFGGSGTVSIQLPASPPASTGYRGLQQLGGFPPD